MKIFQERSVTDSLGIIVVAKRSSRKSPLATMVGSNVNGDFYV